ncbi:hypothetical protein [Gilvimarinus chinensis]|uniref:hypothetical protein n=1 Tax=Gilvimarinus chinensis TaxID=396005 RepID=UPI00037254B1|nr:hypothetical protein [Gilvimarinus chinensis]
MSYEFSDVKKQTKMLTEDINQNNQAARAAHIASGGSPYSFVPGTIDLECALKAMRRRVARFYGLNNKYDGNGNLRKAA